MKCFRWLFAFFLVLTSQVDARFPHGSAVQFTHVQIGGAGAVIGVTSVPSANLLIARTDQFNCYLSVNGSQWSPLLRTNNAPTGLAAIDANGTPLGNGCDAGVAAPSAPTELWIGANGAVFRSLDQGSTFTDTCYAHLSFGDGFSPSQTPGIKGFSPLIAVDPNNNSIVYMSTPTSGLVVTYDKGVTCFTIAAVGTGGAVSGSDAPAGGGHLIAFDTSAGTTATCPHSASICTKNVYVSTYGTGVYGSTDGGVNFSLKNTAGMPTTHLYMTSDNKGNLWLLDNANSNSLGALQKYNGTAWSTPSGLPTSPPLGVGVAIDPNNCSAAATCHIAVTLSGGGGSTGSAFSTGGGANGTWNVAQTITTVSSDVPWIAPRANVGFGYFPTGAAFDNSGHVYSGGEGAYWYTPPAAGSSVTFNSQTSGIEESLSSSVITTPTTSGKVYLGTWDINCFVNLTMPYTSFPSDPTNRGCQGYTTVSSALQRTYNIDYASANTDFLIALTDSQGGYAGGGSYVNYSGTSTDKGATWSPLSAPPIVTAGGAGTEKKGGCIAAASTTNFMWLPTDGSGGSVFPQYTTNGGSNWTAITVSGVTAGWPFQFYLQSKVCAADRVAANTFYIYNWNIGSGADAIIRCTSGGASCTNQSNPGLGPNQQYFSVLKTVPGNSGHIFLSTMGNNPANSAAGSLSYYTDGGVTPNVVANMKGVVVFGFGAAFPGHTYPAIVVAGYYNGVYGIWQSIDWDGAKTWQKIGDYPRGLGVTMEDIDGDKVTPNVFYYTTNSGLFCSAPSTAYCNGGT